jgi:hypothetical protein
MLETTTRDGDAYGVSKPTAQRRLPEPAGNGFSYRSNK